MIHYKKTIGLEDAYYLITIHKHLQPNVYDLRKEGNIMLEKYREELKRGGKDIKIDLLPIYNGLEIKIKQR